MEKYGLLFESIFKRKLTDDDTAGYLKNITKDHPYFSVAQFYLLRLSPKNVNGYKKQARKTAVLFNNNHWLNFQLLEAGFDGGDGDAAEPIPHSFPEKIADDIFSTGKNITGDEPAMTDIDSTTAREEAIQQEITPAVATEDMLLEEEIKEEESGEIEPVVINEPVIASDDNTVDEVIADETVAYTVEEIKEATNEAPESIEEVVVDEPLSTASQTVIEPVEETGSITVEYTHKPAAEAGATLPTPVAEEKSDITEQEEKENTAHAAAVNEQHTEPLLFEPLHTTDYFASVGIKLSEEEKTSGNLGKQLKSFTEWLKTMKKVHAEQLSKTSSPSDVNLSSAESNIQKLAEKSNKEGNVITEAMADVLMQQGKAEKAVEILEKLSLLNPGKSVYFAAKINQIKEK